jgi:hypothetical protein
MAIIIDSTSSKGEELQGDRSLSTVQAYTYNGKTVQIDLREIPEFSAPSLEVLKNLKVQLPEHLQTATPLKDRLSTVEKITKSLKEAGDDRTNCKIATLIGGVGVIALVAIGVSCLVNASFADAYFVIPTASLAALGLGRHSWELWNREMLLQRSLDEQSEPIRQSLLEHQQHNERILPQAHPYYTSETAQRVISLIEARIQEKETVLVSNPKQKAQIKGDIADCQNAKLELQKVIDFYRIFTK